MSQSSEPPSIMSLEDLDFTMTTFEPSTAELESEPSLNVSSDIPVAGQDVHILIGDDEESEVDAPVEPQFHVDTHPILAVEGLSPPRLSPVSVESSKPTVFDNICSPRKQGRTTLCDRGAMRQQMD